MKKTIYAATTAGVLGFGGIVFANVDSAETLTSQPANQPPAAESQNATSEKLLSFEEASKKALEIANGTITDIELDDDKNKPHYEVEIRHEGYEYDLKLDAVSGAILRQDREKEDEDDGAEKPADGIISSNEAVEAARTVAKGQVKEVHLDDDDDDDNGSVNYEVELRDGKTEHEVSVNAMDGSAALQASGNDDDDDDDDDKDDNDDDDDDNDDD
ncbi:PepSY domain-containing protein [Planomicrobium sp. CPCC 101079]|uniref:PepSY domain-containing protein n=1 Tax=Planomicrobium sp. CPCC 101079 TaxID=2599618 RepID=UPI001646405B|nr:PepSY domain-containing protein [Planomicrobium sp. CPCC 101079]